MFLSFLTLLTKRPVYRPPLQQKKIVSIAALHVLAEYRKLGLGRLVLQSLALMHVRLARQVLSTRSGHVSIPRTALYAHADCMDYNIPTMVFMERCGWRRVGNYLWVGVVPHSQARPVSSAT